MWNTFDGRVADDAYERPSSIGLYESGNWRPLTASAKNTQMSLAEIFYGKGTLLACQLHVIENLENPQAKRLFDNMVSYLSQKNPETFNGTVKIAGNITPEKISELTLAIKNNLVDDANTKYLFAFKDTNQEKIQEWTENGGTVVVFSNQLAENFNDVSILANKVGADYVATKVNNHPLLEGISSGNFKSTLTNGYFTNIPRNAKVLLQGFETTMGLWRIEEAGPVMISMPYEKGEVILSTIEIDEKSNNAAKEFLRQLLTNIKVPVKYTELKPETISIKKTVPITVDGKLDEWLDDMDDRFVSQYVHATPVYLTSQHTVEGPTAYDLKLSGINYFLWNKAGLHIAGVVFSEEKTDMSDVKYGAAKAYTQQILFNDDVINIEFKDGKSTVQVNGKTQGDLVFKNGQLDSKFMTDATKLQFSYINGGGDITTLYNLVGETYELTIPWGQLTSRQSKEKSKVMIHLGSKGTKLQVPLTADKGLKDTWMDFKFSDN
jgi:hypothetical protein